MALNFSKMVNLYEKIHPILMKMEYLRQVRQDEYKKLSKKCKLTKEQKKQIDKFFLENYGEKVPYDYHQLYTAFHGKFHEYYIPEYIFRGYIESTMNPPLHRKVLKDKNLLELLCQNVEGARTPKTFASCAMGRFRTAERELISKDEFIKYISNLGECVCKPTIDSGSGKNVIVCNLVNGVDTISGDSAEKIVKDFDKNFLFQEKVVPHEVLSTLYPDSINTFRVTSYIFEDKIYHCPIVLKMGSGGAFLDNVNAGGLFTFVSDDGYVGEKALLKKEDKQFTHHPDTGVKFEGYHIPQVKKMIEVSERIHSLIPQLGSISYDFSIDKDGNIVVVEFNLDGSGFRMQQLVTDAPVFGDNTKKMLKWVRDNKRKK